LYMKKVYADKTLGYSEDASFNIPSEISQLYDCKSQVESSDDSDNIFGTDF